MKTDLQKVLSRIHRMCKAQGVTYLVTIDPANIRYLTGCTMHAPGDGVMLITPTKVILFSDSRYEGELLRIAARNPLIRIFIWDRLTPWDDVARFVRKGSTLGFEKMSQYASYTFVGGLRVAAKRRGIHTRGIKDVLVVVRSVKSASEIAVLRKAFAFSDQAFEKILKRIRPGVTELEISQEFGRYLCELSGCEDLSFATIVASGQNSGIPHATPSDMTRTVFVGKPCEELRRIYEIVLAAQTVAETAAGPGLTGQDIDKVARDIIIEAGYGDYFGHSTGHGVGLDIHEKPHLTYAGPGANVLEEGMVFSIEPGIYLPGRFGVRIENVVVVTRSGIKPFNQAPKELLVL